MKKHELNIYLVSEEENTLSLVFNYKSDNMKDIHETLKNKVTEYTKADDVEYIINTYKNNEIVKVQTGSYLQVEV